MPTIKRYPNRKLYDTEAKRYITLDGIAELIRNGEDVQVIDHKTEEDLTALTLTQIIFEQEKKKGGFLPTSVLTGLVQAGGSTVNSLKRGLTAPLNLLQDVDHEIERRFQILISKGEIAKEEGLRLRDKLLSLGARNSDSAEMPSDPLSDDAVSALLEQKDLVSRDEVNQLNAQLEQLSAQLDNLLAARAQASDESANGKSAS